MLVCVCGKKFDNRRTLALHLSRVKHQELPSPLDKEKFIVDLIFGPDTVESYVTLYREE